MSSLYLKVEGYDKAWRIWPESDEIPPGVVAENTSVVFELADTDGALDSELLVDGVPLEALRSRSLRAARWRWLPGFHAGVVELTLKVPGARTRRVEVTTDPDRRKLAREEFDVMIREILEDTFALFSVSSFRKGIGRQSPGKLPPLARLEYIRSRFERICEVVEEIVRSPRGLLRAEEVVVPFHSARKAKGPEIVKSFRSGRVLIEADGTRRLPSALLGKIPASIRTRRRTDSHDTPEHRQIRACLTSWASWLAVVSEQLSRADLEDSSDSVRQAWASRTRRMSIDMGSLAGSDFFTGVGEGSAFLKISSVFRNCASYRDFYRLWQDMNFGLAAVFGDYLQMPIARTFDLYELWSFLRLLRAAVDEFGPDAEGVSELFIERADGGVELKSGAISVRVGDGRALCFQRRYREYWVEDGRRGTFSRTMVPDIVIASNGPRERHGRIIVLDAKYRIDEGLNDALGSIHMYRDALVQETADGALSGVVSAAYLLTPFVPFGLDSDYKQVPVPGRLFHPKYRNEFKFGAVTLRPGMPSSEIRECLRTVLADAEL